MSSRNAQIWTRPLKVGCSKRPSKLRNQRQDKFSGDAKQIKLINKALVMKLAAFPFTSK